MTRRKATTLAALVASGTPMGVMAGKADVKAIEEIRQRVDGETLRDQFAMVAMLGMMINPQEWINSETAARRSHGNEAYRLADSMMMARNRPTEPPFDS